MYLAIVNIPSKDYSIINYSTSYPSRLAEIKNHTKFILGIFHHIDCDFDLKYVVVLKDYNIPICQKFIDGFFDINKKMKLTTKEDEMIAVWYVNFFRRSTGIYNDIIYILKDDYKFF